MDEYDVVIQAAEEIYDPKKREEQQVNELLEIMTPLLQKKIKFAVTERPDAT
jgi:hypothetical protein